MLELILSTISAGGLVGAANQYACLLIVAIAARLNIITLSTQTSFLESYWFIGITAFFWLITLAPAYSSLLSPGLSNVINTISNFISGFVVPVSSALLSLASIGVIVNLNPELENILETFKILTIDGNIGATGYIIAAGGAATATTLTGLRALAKPAISTATGTTGTVSAPIYATIENVAALLLMGLAYLFASVNPWLLVALFAVVTACILALVVYALYQLRKLGKGLGKVLALAQTNPRAGLAVICEFFIWGIGWLAWKQWGRAAIMLFFLALWLVVFFIAQPLFVGLFAFIPFLVPVVGALTIVVLLLVFIAIGLNSARALLRAIEKESEIQPA